MGDLRVDLQEEFSGRIIELQFGATALAAFSLGELLRHFSGGGGGIGRGRISRLCASPCIGIGGIGAANGRGSRGTGLRFSNGGERHGRA